MLLHGDRQHTTATMTDWETSPPLRRVAAKPEDDEGGLPGIPAPLGQHGMPGNTDQVHAVRGTESLEMRINHCVKDVVAQVLVNMDGMTQVSCDLVMREVRHGEINSRLPAALTIAAARNWSTNCLVPALFRRQVPGMRHHSSLPPTAPGLFRVSPSTLGCHGEYSTLTSG